MRRERSPQDPGDYASEHSQTRVIKWMSNGGYVSFIFRSPSEGSQVTADRHRVILKIPRISDVKKNVNANCTKLSMLGTFSPFNFNYKSECGA